MKLRCYNCLFIISIDNPNDELICPNCGVVVRDKKTSEQKNDAIVCTNSPQRPLKIIVLETLGVILAILMFILLSILIRSC